MPRQGNVWQRAEMSDRYATKRMKGPAVTDEERKLLEMCRPEVTLQGSTRSQREDIVARNPHFYVAAGCEQNGWLEFVREQDFNQCVYRITQAGADALAKR